MIVGEITKHHFNLNQNRNLYFWRDHTGHEVDLIVDHGLELYPIEIKSGKTVNEDFFKGLRQWSKISGQTNGGTIIYAGDTIQKRSDNMTVLPWKLAHTVGISETIMETK